MANLDVMPFTRDVHGVIHGWTRFRTAVDDSEDYTWCALWIPTYGPRMAGWTFLSHAAIDCMLCLGQGPPHYAG